jgi:ribose transport system permease protein
MSKTTGPVAVSRNGPRVAISRHDVAAFVQRWALLVVLGVVVAGFSISLPDQFATTANFQDILNSQPPLVFIALGSMLVLVAGEFDLSLGAILGLSQYLVLKLMGDGGIAWPLAVVITLAAATLIGLVNAAFVVGLGINSFVATIGVATVLGGLLEWLSHGNAPLIDGAAPGFTELAQTDVGGIALPVLYALLAAIVIWVVLEYTVTGSELRSTGANRQAALLSGLRTKRASILAFASAALLSGIGGVLITARVGAADATSGPGYLLPAYAAVFLGATAIRPGSFNVWGTVIAIFVVAVGITGLQLEGADSWVTPAFNGTILLIAVTVSALAARRRGARTS